VNEKENVVFDTATINFLLTYYMKLLTSYDIDELCQRYTIKLNGIYCRDEIPLHLHNGWYILNMDKATGEGTHWCCWHVGDHNMYFDSFGFPPPNQLEHKLETFTYNAKKIQNLNSDSCGWFCLMCIKYCEDRGNSPRAFNQYLSLFSDKSATNEKY
jgi:hypothetical protein